MGALVSEDDFDLIKRAAAEALPGVKSSHRAEASARGLGFGSVAALRSAFSSEPVRSDLRDDLFRRYLSSRGFDVGSGVFGDILQRSGILGNTMGGEPRIGARLLDGIKVSGFVWSPSLGTANWPIAFAPPIMTGDPAVYDQIVSLRTQMRSVPIDPASFAPNPSSLGGAIDKLMRRENGVAAMVLRDGSVASRRDLDAGHPYSALDFGPALLLPTDTDASSRPRTIRAPWTPEQVALLAGHQANGSFHPYTCPGEGNCPRRELVPTVGGWVCACGSYGQDWAHDPAPQAIARGPSNACRPD